MTQTMEPAAAAKFQTPQERVDAWLADFEAALAARDLDWQMRYSIDEMVRTGWEARQNAL